MNIMIESFTRWLVGKCGLDSIHLAPVSPLARVTSTRIVCGDCAGDEVAPRQTLLRSDHSCAECGGHNYALAAPLAIPRSAVLREVRAAAGQSLRLGREDKTREVVDLF